MVTGHGNNICILVVDVLTSIFFVYSPKLFIPPKIPITMRFGFRLAQAQAILKLSFLKLSHRTLAMYIAPSFTQKIPAVSSRAHFDTQI